MQATSLTSQNLISTSVTVNGASLPVYQAKDVDGSATKYSAYIESKQGQEFKVKVDVGTIHSTVIIAALYLDGTLQESYAMDPARGDRSCTFVGRRDTATSVRPFLFQKFVTTDDEDIATTSESVIKGLGTIQVRIARAVLNNYRDAGPKVYEEEKSKVVNEKAKKAALSHQVGLGKAVYMAPPGSVNLTHIEDYRTAPWITFDLLYRSRDLLELENIIPPSAASESPSATPDPDLVVPKQEKKKRKETEKRKTTVLILSDSEDEETVRERKKVKLENERIKKEKAAKGGKKETQTIVID